VCVFYFLVFMYLSVGKYVGATFVCVCVFIFCNTWSAENLSRMCVRVKEGT